MRPVQGLILKPFSWRWINFTSMEKCHLEMESFYFKLSKHSTSLVKYQNMIWLQIFYPVLIYRTGSPHPAPLFKICSENLT